MHQGMLFILLKNEKCYSNKELKIVFTRQIIDFRVPYHYLKNQQTKDDPPEGAKLTAKKDEL